VLLSLTPFWRAVLVLCSHCLSSSDKLWTPIVLQKLLHCVVFCLLLLWLRRACYIPKNWSSRAVICLHNHESFSSSFFRRLPYRDIFQITCSASLYLCYMSQSSFCKVGCLWVILWTSFWNSYKIMTSEHSTSFNASDKTIYETHN
jgi:hypothetical protein